MDRQERKGLVEVAPASFPLVGKRYRFRRILLSRDRPSVAVVYAASPLVPAARWGALLLALAGTLLLLRGRRRWWTWALAAALTAGLLLLAHYVMGVHRRLVWGVVLALLLALARHHRGHLLERLRATLWAPWRLGRLITARALLLCVGASVVLSVVLAYPMMLSLVALGLLVPYWRRRSAERGARSAELESAERGTRRWRTQERSDDEDCPDHGAGDLVSRGGGRPDGRRQGGVRRHHQGADRAQPRPAGAPARGPARHGRRLGGAAPFRVLPALEPGAEDQRRGQAQARARGAAHRVQLQRPGGARHPDAARPPAGDPRAARSVEGGAAGGNGGGAHPGHGGRQAGGHQHPARLPGLGHPPHGRGHRGADPGGAAPGAAGLHRVRLRGGAHAGDLVLLHVSHAGVGAAGGRGGDHGRAHRGRQDGDAGQPSAHQPHPPARLPGPGRRPGRQGAHLRRDPQPDVCRRGRPGALLGDPLHHPLRGHQDLRGAAAAGDHRGLGRGQGRLPLHPAQGRRRHAAAGRDRVPDPRHLRDLAAPAAQDGPRVCAGRGLRGAAAAVSGGGA